MEKFVLGKRVTLPDDSTWASGYMRKTLTLCLSQELTIALSHTLIVSPWPTWPGWASKNVYTEKPCTWAPLKTNIMKGQMNRHWNHKVLQKILRYKEINIGQYKKPWKNVNDVTSFSRKDILTLSLETWNIVITLLSLTGPGSYNRCLEMVIDRIWLCES